MEFFSFFYIIIPIIVFVTSIKEGKRLIPKKDAFRVFKQTQIGIVVLALIISGTLLYLQFSLYPTIDRLYQSLNYNNPFPPSFVSYFTFLAIAIFQPLMQENPVQILPNAKAVASLMTICFLALTLQENVTVGLKL